MENFLKNVGPRFSSARSSASTNLGKYLQMIHSLERRFS